jgi:hypothetical protein
VQLYGDTAKETMTLPTEKTWKISVIYFSSDTPLPQMGGGGGSLFSLKKNWVGILSFSSVNLTNFAKFLVVNFSLSQN